MKKAFQKVKPWLIFAVLLLIWYAVTATGLVKSYILPSVWSVFYAFVEMIKSGELFSSLLVSILRVLFGWLLAFVFALLFSIIRVFSKGAWEYLRYFDKFIRSIAPLSLFPFLILLFGIGEGAKLVVIALTAFFPMFVNFSSSFENADKDLVDLGRSLGFSKMRMFFKIYLPLSYYSMLTGIQTSLSYAYRSLVGVEIISSYKGLGYIIEDSLLLHNLSRMFVGIITLALVGMIFDGLFSFILKKCFKNYVR